MTVPSVAAHLARIKQIHQAVQTHLAEAQQRQKEYADRHRRELTFQLGDYVMLDTRNLLLKGSESRKLAVKFVGPYRVVARYGSAAYKL